MHEQVLRYANEIVQALMEKNTGEYRDLDAIELDYSVDCNLAALEAAAKQVQTDYWGIVTDTRVASKTKFFGKIVGQEVYMLINDPQRLGELQLYI